MLPETIKKFIIDNNQIKGAKSISPSQKPVND